MRIWHRAQNIREFCLLPLQSISCRVEHGLYAGQLLRGDVLRDVVSKGEGVLQIHRRYIIRQPIMELTIEHADLVLDKVEFRIEFKESDQQRLYKMTIFLKYSNEFRSIKLSFC